MNPLLAPQPMTPAEVADLVERTRANGRAERVRRMKIASDRAKAARHARAHPARAAAQHAHDHGMSIPDLVRLTGIADSTIRYWWGKLYPDEQPVSPWRGV